MKIAYILPSLKNNGPIVVVKNLVEILTDLGHEIDVYYFDKTSLVMKFDCSVKHISFNIPIDFDLYDIVHSHCFRPDLYVYKWKKRIHKAKIISTLHQDTYHCFRDRYNSLLAHIFTSYWCYIHSKFDYVISISDCLREAYKDKIKSPMITIHNGCAVTLNSMIDLSIIDKLQQIRKIYKILGTYAFVVPCKGLSQVIKTLPYLLDYAFVIIGEGPDIENLKKISQNLNVSDRVFFFPYQKYPCNYLSYFDVYVMPSYSEGFGMSMVEAALAQKSIVCSDIPVFHEIFVDKKEAHFFVLDNIKSLESAILSAYEFKESFGKAAFSKANRDFTTWKMAKNYEAFCKQIIY